MRESDKYRLLFEHSPDAILLSYPDGAIVAANPAACRMFQMTEEELCRVGRAGIVVADERPPAGPRERVAGGPARAELAYARKDGTHFIGDTTSVVIDPASARPHSFVIVRDVTERLQAAAAIREKSEEFDRFFDLAIDLLCITDKEGRFVRVSRHWHTVLGYAPQQLLGRRAIDFVHPHDVEATRSAGRHADGRIINFVNRYRASDGSYRWLEWRAVWDGKQTFAVARDVTDRRRADAEIVRLNRLYAVLGHVNEAIIRVRSREELFAEVCRVLTRFGGFDMAWIGLTDPATARVMVVASDGDPSQYLEKISVYADDRPEGHGPVGTAIRDGRTYVCNDFLGDPRTLPFRHAAGEAAWRAMLAVPLRLNGEAVGALSVYASEPHVFGPPEVALLEETATDISFGAEALDRDARRHEAEEALREGERRFKGLIEAANEPIFVQTDQCFAYVNDAALRLFGAQRPEQLLGQPVLERFHPASRDGVAERMRTLNEQREAVPLLEEDALRLDGTRVSVEVSASPIVYEGRPGAVVFARDITERKVLERQLLHAQRMESVGRLAGGVAHDFNNMLSVIMGYAELRLSLTAEGDPARDDLKEILAAAQKSADLTRQLLAFARKQTIRPQVLHLNECIASTLKMLERMIGEDITLEWKPSDDLWPVKIDRSQVDQVLTNLVVNSRDAMPGGGTITIETRNEVFDSAFCGRHPAFTPGHYVRLEVTDTGTGMTPEVLRQVFDPFFTTKPTGHGTGLGLATVYGIVKQHGGFVDVSSEPGSGTSFKCWFPRHQAAGASLDPDEARDAAPQGTETVLMVEDSEAILRLGRTMLETLGYNVLSATSPAEAIDRGGQHPGVIHLLVTDVIMPGLNGRDLYDRLRKDRPSLKCLYMSGYPADVIADRGVLDDDVRFVQKPFSLATLAQGVREALDR